MLQVPQYRSVTTTDGGGNAVGPCLIGLTTFSNNWVLGGSTFSFSSSENDFPRRYAARVKRRVLPVVGNNSEQIAFPELVHLSMQVMQVGLGLVSGAEKPPRGEFWAQRRQQADPIWFKIGAVTKDKNSGAAIAGCTVKLYRTVDDVVVATTTSDGSGNYAFWVNNSVDNYYARAYKTGSPDIAGTTLNTLTGV